jgi:hypothetical protein
MQCILKTCNYMFIQDICYNANYMFIHHAQLPGQLQLLLFIVSSPESDFPHRFGQSALASAGIEPCIKPRPLSSTFFPFVFLLMILLFGGIECDESTALLNKEDI